MLLAEIHWDEDQAFRTRDFLTSIMPVYVFCISQEETTESSKNHEKIQSI